jgi:hypothetical protein
MVHVKELKGAEKPEKGRAQITGELYGLFLLGNKRAGNGGYGKENKEGQGKFQRAE